MKAIVQNSRLASGYTLIGLLVILAILALIATSTVQLGALVQRRNAEQQLLDIGAEYRAALISYASATPAGQPNAPASLEELLKDPRYPNIRRHLRKIYADPITGSTQWGMILSPENNRIIGVYSQSEQEPIKISGFPSPFEQFEGKHHYSEWIFANGIVLTNRK